MLKKKLLLSLVIFQGLLIIVGIIAIIFGVFYKMSNKNNTTIITNKNIDGDFVGTFDYIDNCHSYV